ncbi:MAG: hypothetical protein KKD35_03705, partial [Elusimicrobia bacterium]|nr:hypothetical protein [Elusimicrobiota bacterium]
FLKGANVNVTDYKEAQEIISTTAKILKVNEPCLDHTIWLYMSNKVNTGIINTNDCTTISRRKE